MTSTAVREFATSDDEVYLKKLGYSIGTTIGEGSYAKVKSAYSDRLQKRVAMKIINRRSAPRDFKEKFLPRELKCLRAINHVHCIKLYEIIEFEQKVTGLCKPIHQLMKIVAICQLQFRMLFGRHTFLESYLPICIFSFSSLGLIRGISKLKRAHFFTILMIKCTLL